MELTATKRNIQPFNGDKYIIWKLRIRELFKELKVIEVIDGPTEQIDNEVLIEK